MLEATVFVNLGVFYHERSHKINLLLCCLQSFVVDSSIDQPFHSETFRKIFSITLTLKDHSFLVLANCYLARPSLLHLSHSLISSPPIDTRYIKVKLQLLRQLFLVDSVLKSFITF